MPLMEVVQESSSFTEQQLLPGIPDQITISHITPKLPWRTINILSSVSYSWRQAIHSREVYRSRVSSNSTETLLVINHRHTQDGSALSLYSIKDNAVHRLPPIPRRRLVRNPGLPWGCQFVALDGKLYVLGGTKEYGSSEVNRIVYVLDLAAQLHWQECTHMPETRVEFGCGVINGKIYVFGGFLQCELIGAEVYDPETNSWSPITPPQVLISKILQVTACGEELFLHGGDFFGSHYPPDARAAFLWEAYHPENYEWRTFAVKAAAGGHTFEAHAWQDFIPRVFASEGRLYCLSRYGIHLLECEEWTQMHTISCDELGPSGCVFIEPQAALAVNGEVLAMVNYLCTRPHNIQGSCLLQSRGFGSANRHIEWQKLRFYTPRGEPSYTSQMVAIHL
ncbi:unnamed protein product [Calypogeia fissa]